MTGGGSYVAQSVFIAEGNLKNIASSGTTLAHKKWHPRTFSFKHFLWDNFFESHQFVKPYSLKTIGFHNIYPAGRRVHVAEGLTF